MPDFDVHLLGSSTLSSGLDLFPLSEGLACFADEASLQSLGTRRNICIFDTYMY